MLKTLPMETPRARWRLEPPIVGGGAKHRKRQRGYAREPEEERKKRVLVKESVEACEEMKPNGEREDGARLKEALEKWQSGSRTLHVESRLASHPTRSGGAEKFH